MSCASRCFEIGGPWITYDPNCPLHGDEAREREKLSLEERIVSASKDDEIKYLKRRNKELQKEIDNLKLQINSERNKPCPVCITGVWCKVHEDDSY